ncbi:MULTISPECIES: glycosyltransferase family 4 protein [Staphylococcus]|jgi:UDP-GlcNAc:undecaprenyl-phosphate GlcNAc-1-phosphate transferase|uniref:Undecaprenyl/decaprenyl-phosphate alpha-N-acetylglucosaminyl 1-phosphate transferase n=1 Tax=Staphylococcus shinii TaxID=2912228 RepID=A0A418IJ97_9STAP|nr:MraY family glycosyltransferase [Staphylococcus shinii]MBO3066009.1 undecaprenyl/decaprenyl-phosphate alpha-N-acetylglucosaminyl 1-phosphate transferase [Staphylococcus shinii]MDW8564263.1 MraY family glycosyltransferase [Staphylococcus shinii]MDW8567490.1 MraY family glycosyltransferase [Staphylococcus shinii]MDW8570428.1 MraY family glycosyltransferase [Staphylococcus shinii]MDW8573666.1 MraY family glycosyltransferase [Staphylococcus shinii]
MYTLLLIIFSMIVSLILTPIVIKVSHKLGIVDQPNFRKVHTKPISVLGGTVILISFLVGIWLGHPIETEVKPLVIGSVLIYLVGLIDDIYDLKPIIKLLGQVIAALVVVYYGVTIDFISLPIGPTIHFGILGIPITVVWIVAITNAINLIDGLDGLASGVSMIALMTIGFIAILQANIFIMMICSVLIGALLGFLFFNFHPAKIFLGDSGALLVGFIVGFLSLLGFKNITFVSLFFPIVILAVPFIDTLFAMIRRVKKGQHIMQADKSHLHHKFLELGYSHRQTVLLIYSIAILFSLASIILYLSQPWGVLMMFILILITIELIVEFTGLIDDEYRPLLKLIENKEQHDDYHK